MKSRQPALRLLKLAPGRFTLRRFTAILCIQTTYRQRRRFCLLARMATLSEITLYPIKSCAGIALRSATLTRAGLATESVHDREWMLVDGAGNFLSQREHPRMALIVPHLTAGTLQLSAPGMPPLEIGLGLPDPAAASVLTVQLWGEPVTAFDCGAASAAWFSGALGTACRLVRFHPGAVRLASDKWCAGVAAPNRFSDGFPVLLIGTASLADLNQKLLAAGRAALPMNRFRPNLVIDGMGAFEEDYAAALQLGDMQLKPVKPCPRCPIPSVDQATGIAGPDPLDLLRTYRARAELDGAICFGMNCIVIEGEQQHVHVGQEIAVTLAF